MTGSFASPDIRKETDAFVSWSPIGKTFQSFDNMLPVEDPDKLAVILVECKRKPDTDPVLDALGEKLRPIMDFAAMQKAVNAVGVPAELVTRGEQMADAGTRFIISGGEVLEIDGQTPDVDENEYPF